MANQTMTKAQFTEFVRGARTAAIATADRRGNPESAIVELGITDDGTLLFQTKVASRKVKNLSFNPRVAIIIGWGPVSLQVEGESELLIGSEREAPAADYAAQFPYRPALTDDFALYRVRPDWMRRYEARPGQPPLVSEGLPV